VLSVAVEGSIALAVKEHRAPQAFDTAEQAIDDAAKHGVAIWRGALDDKTVAVVRERVWAAANSERHRMEGIPGYDFDNLNIRVMDLLGFDPVFRALAFHPVAMRAVEHFLGRRPLLSNFNGNITRPGSGGSNGDGGMHVHADQGFVLPPWPEEPLAWNCIWAIDDFSEETGATRIVPGSHLLRRRPHSTNPTDHDLVSIECPAGSMILLDGRVWHTTGVNRSRDRDRVGLFGYYVRGWLRPQVNWAAALDPAIASELTEAHLEILGYGPVANQENLMGFKD
jgi:hypothetical protein